MRGWVLAAAAGLALVVGGAAPAAESTDAVLTIERASGGPAATLTEAALKDLPRQTARLRTGDKETPYEGPSLTAVLRAAGAPVGVKLHGKPLASYVVVTGRDGYRAILSIAETDAWIADNKIILADRHADGPLDANEGKLRLVIDGDRRPERSVRDVVSVAVVQP